MTFFLTTDDTRGKETILLFLSNSVVTHRTDSKQWCLLISGIDNLKQGNANIQGGKPRIFLINSLMLRLESNLIVETSKNQFKDSNLEKTI